MAVIVQWASMENVLVYVKKARRLQCLILFFVFVLVFAGWGPAWAQQKVNYYSEVLPNCCSILSTIILPTPCAIKTVVASMLN